jgi:DNA-3-methyladenine glycosylase I
MIGGVMRCFGDGDPLYERYHDDEWGRPVTDDAGIYERVCLEGFQSGISWRIVLGKRATIRAAFADFDPGRVAGFDDDDVERLLHDPGVIRNRRKIEAAIANARATVEMKERGTPLGELVWSFATDKGAPRDFSEMPGVTEDSTELAKRLRRNGFRFVGPTTVYATMQALGVVNDHLAGCSVRADVERERRAVLKSLV